MIAVLRVSFCTQPEWTPSSSSATKRLKNTQMSDMMRISFFCIIVGLSMICVRMDDPDPKGNAGETCVAVRETQVLFF